MRNAVTDFINYPFLLKVGEMFHIHYCMKLLIFKPFMVCS